MSARLARWLSAVLLLSLVAGPANAAESRARLIVLVVVDQLGANVLTQWGRHLDGGIAELIRRGAHYLNGEHAQANTSTGPGHATVATGAWPNVHGLVSNRWYDANDGAQVYCVEDPVHGISPEKLMAPTMGDALKISTFGKGKVAAVAIKDRVAVITSGGKPDLAAFYDYTTGRWTTGRWYGAKTPDWVEAINRKQNARAAFGQTWDRLRDDLDYASIAGRDDSPYEGDIPGMGRTFPRRLGAGLPGPNEAWLRSYRGTPAALEALFTLGKQAFDKLELGTDEHVDLLTIGVSSQDYVGHWFGPHSQEAFDHLLRVDREIGSLIAHVEAKLGSGSVVWAMTADHGINMTPEISRRHGAKGRRVPVEELKELANVELAKRKRPGNPPLTIPVVDAPLVFIGHEDRGANRVAMRRLVASALIEHPHILDAWSVDDIDQIPEPFAAHFERIVFPGRSADVFVLNKPHHLLDPRGYTTGSGHGSPYNYDVRVPIVLAGPGVRPGVDPTPVHVTRVAPSLAVLGGFDAPASALDPPLPAVLP